MGFVDISTFETPEQDEEGSSPGPHTWRWVKEVPASKRKEPSYITYRKNRSKAVKVVEKETQDERRRARNKRKKGGK
jgi:hypothetical protein